MKLNWYNIISRAVDEGITTGYRVAHKHTKSPDMDNLTQAIYDSIMNSLSEVVAWEEE